jgi:hypothetical protein
MSNAIITFVCPPMAIDKAGHGLKRTHAEPMTATVFIPDEPNIVIYPVTIPPTLVHGHGLNWTVDACKGEGEANGNHVEVDLPEELTKLDKGPKGWGIYAQPITANVVLSLADGRTFKGTVKFGECLIQNPLFNPVAEAITTTGGELTPN